MSDHFNAVEKILDFELDPKGEVWAVFIAKEDQRRFPLKGLVIQAQLYSIVKDAAKPKEKLEALTYDCVRHATQKCRPKSERDDDFLEEDGLVCAILNLLARRKKNAQKPEWTGTVTQLLESLGNLPEEERFDYDEWPRRSKFASYLRARTNVLKALSVDLTYKRVGTGRNYTLKFVGKKAEVQHMQVTVEDDLFEMLGLYDPKPMCENPVTQSDAQDAQRASQDDDASDAQDAQQASQGDDAGDAQDAQQASQPIVWHVRERVRKPEEAPDSSDQDPLEPAQV